MISIIERPTKNVLGVNVSNWTAGHNAVVYKFKREDYNIGDINGKKRSTGTVRFG